jgi:FG-GAP-like repeat
MPNLNAETSVFNFNNRGASASLDKARSTFYQVLENMDWSLPYGYSSSSLLRLNEPKVTDLASLPAGTVSANTETFDTAEHSITRLANDSSSGYESTYSIKTPISPGSSTLSISTQWYYAFGGEYVVADFGQDRLANLGSIDLPIKYNGVTNPDAGRYVYFTRNETELWLHWDGYDKGAFKALTLPTGSILGVYKLNDQLILNTTGGLKAVEISFSRDPIRTLIGGDYHSIKTLAREIGGEALAQEVILPEVNPGAWKLEGFRDYDGDGDADLFWHNGQTGQIAFWQMKGLSFERSVFAPEYNYEGWSVSTFGDFDRDGDQDIVWKHFDGTVATWEMRGLSFGSGSVLYKVARTTPYVDDLGWYVSGVGDFNGDNNLEILWRSAEGVMATWEIKNFQISKASYLGTNVAEGWSVRASMDFDGDRDTDILWENKNTGQLALWTMQAGKLQGGAFLPVSLGMGGTTERLGPYQQNQVYGGQFDFDGDGILDIWWRSNFTQNKEVWKFKKNGSTLSYDRTVLKDGSSYQQAV